MTLDFNSQRPNHFPGCPCAECDPVREAIRGLREPVAHSPCNICGKIATTRGINDELLCERCADGGGSAMIEHGRKMMEDIINKGTPEPEQQIRRLGGEGWLTQEDLKRFSKQTARILTLLHRYPNMWHGRAGLEKETGSKRVASRINELQDYFVIESRRGADNMAEYRLTGRRETPKIRNKKKHCETCTCKA